MGWFDAKELKFDLDVLSQMRKKLQDTATELEEQKQSLIKAFEGYKEYWNTDTGGKFVESVDTDWVQQVDKYINIIEALEQCLAEAEKEYATVKDRAEAIKF